MAEHSQTICLETVSVEQTMNVGRAVARLAEPGDVIALSGNLGAGKTQFVRGLATGLGADPREVSSPTFVIMQEYRARPPVIHIDAYRIESLEEVQSLGWTDELISRSVSIVEWAERIEEELPADHLAIELEHTGETRRQLTFRPTGSWVARLEDFVPRDRPASSAISDVACPICKSPASDEFHPFCSSQCKMVDLNRWFQGDYRIGRDVDWENDDLSDMPREENG